ncbi:hypothetical protein [Mesorhizobium sp. WSM3868]|uniref:hypothetical protein n=1 Tax=Mesorhizobium sp. WSM3868 TaxID=2029405 RepID=UPI001181008E|nr:hypothetical protein [Mesorhizobium sp. WSM3868]
MSDDPVNPFPRTLYNNDFRLVAQTREAIDRSRQKLRETRPLVDPHRLSPHSVVVAECGVATITRSFRERVPAFNFAEAQLMRLGLDKMTDN